MNLDLAMLVLRIAVGVVILPHGLLKFGLVGKGGSISGVAGWFQGLGFRPGIFWAYVSALGETLGGVLTILGLGGPIGPGIVAADLVVVTIVAHYPKGFWANEGGWEFPVPLAAGAFAVTLLGNGRWSVDGLLAITYPDWLLPAWLVLMLAGAVLALAVRAMYAPKPKTA
ncbi:MAG: hypothetical protein AUH85_07215 [Chloroflexi bacterium 13_1_40CM_4_68_4]|nr:MAG: hypothetical protein AUH85_07215 [Chloroflexi bacterium 13_1_40CM_4_68_4]